MDDQLKTLYDYTKFHIGMYTTIIVALVAVFGHDTLKHRYRPMLPFLWWTILAFTVAAMMGGLVASSIPYYTHFGQFMGAKLGPGQYKWDWLSGRLATHLEHWAFWLGWGIAIVGLFQTTRLSEPDESTQTESPDSSSSSGSDSTSD